MAAAASNIYLLALMVIITTIQSVLKYLEKLRQKRIEAIKASIEMAEKSKEYFIFIRNKRKYIVCDRNKKSISKISRKNK